MTLHVIGAGFGRTATMSLRMAIEELGLGPCYHMETILGDMPGRVAHWNTVLDGAPDWNAVFDGFGSAVDWPVAAYWHDLAETYPAAKVVLSTRDAGKWWDSFSQTILFVLQSPEKWPPEQRDWLEMVVRVVIDRSLGGRTDREGVIDAFRRNEAAAKEALPADRLLVFEARDGWGPLCEFLGQPIPDTPYPRSNSRQEFFDIMAGKAPG